jgi:NADH-quinone oxidoreductase subunit A
VIAAPLWPLALYALLAVLAAAGMLVVAAFLGERHMDRDTGQPYESGIIATGTARVSLNIQFHLVATFFVIFDLETVFIVAWALVVRRAGWAGLAEMTAFIAVLVVTLAYLWRSGALDWGPARHGADSRTPEQQEAL